MGLVEISMRCVKYATNVSQTQSLGIIETFAQNCIYYEGNELASEGARRPEETTGEEDASRVRPLQKYLKTITMNCSRDQARV